MIDPTKCSHPFRTGTAAELVKGEGVCSICGTEMGQNPTIQAVATMLVRRGHGETEPLQLIENGYRDSKAALNDNEIYPGITPAALDDMAFGYCPSGKIGELREFAEILVGRVLETLQTRNGWQAGRPPADVSKAWLLVRYDQFYQVDLAECNGGSWWSIYEERHGMEITGTITAWQPFTTPDLV